jgi:hypothetical protein
METTPKRSRTKNSKHICSTSLAEMNRIHINLPENRKICERKDMNSRMRAELSGSEMESIILDIEKDYRKWFLKTRT